jgi:uncharacterized protein YdaU (DUF1376 family)
MAYMRLIRWYYRKERPIPADIAEACRQVRASSKAQKQAVVDVLNEFFSLRDDGWHNETCDDVIGAFKAGQPEREAKKKNEETRLSRHRAERAELFKIINDAGLHAHWNIGINELREMAGKVKCNAPETPTKPLPVTAPATPATATHPPDANTQNPSTSSSISEQTTSTTNGSSSAEPSSSPSSRFSQIVQLLTTLELGRGKTFGAVATTDKRIAAWIEKGITDDQIRDAHRLAADEREGTNDPSSVNTGFLDIFIAKLVNPSAAGSAVTGNTKPAKKCCDFDREGAPCQGRVMGDVSGRPYCDTHFDYALDPSNFRKAAQA